MATHGYSVAVPTGTGALLIVDVDSHLGGLVQPKADQWLDRQVGRRQRSRSGRPGFRRHFVGGRAPLAVDELRVHLSCLDVRPAYQPAQEAAVCREPNNCRRGECRIEPGQGGRAVGREGDDLGQQRVVARADDVACAHAGIDAYAVGLRPSCLEHLAGRGQEVVPRVLGVEPCLDGVPGEADRRLIEAERFAGGDAQLIGNEIAAGDRLGHRVLDLEAGVELEEIELAVRRRAGTRLFPRRCIRPPWPSAAPLRPDGLRSFASTTGEGASSMTFWWRRWSEHSRSPRWTALPWLSASS